MRPAAPHVAKRSKQEPDGRRRDSIAHNRSYRNGCGCDPTSSSNKQRQGPPACVFVCLCGADESLHDDRFGPASIELRFSGGQESSQSWAKHSSSSSPMTSSLQHSPSPLPQLNHGKTHTQTQTASPDENAPCQGEGPVGRHGSPPEEERWCARTRDGETPHPQPEQHGNPGAHDADGYSAAPARQQVID